MSEEKHSRDRVPASDGDKRKWKRYLRDVELYLETEQLDVDLSRGARLLSRLTCSARKYHLAENDYRNAWCRFNCFRINQNP